MGQSGYSGAIFLSPPVPTYAFSGLRRQTFAAGGADEQAPRSGFGVDAAQIAPPLSYEFSGGGVMETKSDWYRARAADCAALAERAPDLQAKAVYEQMAQDWLRLAELTDKKTQE